MQFRSLITVGLIVSATFLLGCNTEQIQEAVDSSVQQTTQVVEQTVETVKQEANLVGSMELATNPPLAAKACYVELIDTGEGRPNVLRLASYKSADLERFPSIIIEAHVEESSLGELSGKTVNGKVYAQSQQDGPVLSTPTGSQASLAIGAVDDKSVTCEITSAGLVNSDTGEETAVSGKFVALLD